MLAEQQIRFFWQALLLLIGAGCLSYALTTPVKALALWTGALDIPKDSRRMHVHPIPKLGGLAIFMGFLTALLASRLLTPAVTGLLLGALLIIITGIADDRRPLPPLAKLAGELLAAAVPVAFGVRIESIGNPFGFLTGNQNVPLGNWSIPLTLLWIVGVTNALNLIDGLDGLAAGISGIASLSMFFVALLKGDTISAVITAALAGACFGFFPHNRHPAKIFMGDTGALFLGYTLACVSVMGFFKSYAAISVAVPLLVLGLPLFDTASAFIRRILKGKSPFLPDREHLHHQLVDLGLSQRQTVLVLHSAAALLGAVAVLLAVADWVSALFLCSQLLFALLIIIRAATRTLKSGITDP